VKSLVSQHGLAAARLKAWGVGYTAPIASNRAEEGKAKNRRVELVQW
jgi:OmpA-OmpF porin, OOP family